MFSKYIFSLVFLEATALLLFGAFKGVANVTKTKDLAEKMKQEPHAETECSTNNSFISYLLFIIII